MKTDIPAAERVLDKSAALGIVWQRTPLAAKEAIAFAEIPDRITLDLSALFLKRYPAERTLCAIAAAKTERVLGPVTALGKLIADCPDRLLMDAKFFAGALT